MTYKAFTIHYYDYSGNRQKKTYKVSDVVKNDKDAKKYFLKYHKEEDIIYIEARVF